MGKTWHGSWLDLVWSDRMEQTGKNMEEKGHGNGGMPCEFPFAKEREKNGVQLQTQLAATLTPVGLASAFICHHVGPGQRLTFGSPNTLVDLCGTRLFLYTFASP